MGSCPCWISTSLEGLHPHLSLETLDRLQPVSFEKKKLKEINYFFLANLNNEDSQKLCILTHTSVLIVAESSADVARSLLRLLLF